MLDQITNENELMEDRDLVQFVNVKAKVIERDHVFYIGSFSEDLSFSEHATAHYPNGISITGRFEDHQPAGPCEIVFGATGITETVLFSKGHRTGKATVTYPSGLGGREDADGLHAVPLPVRHPLRPQLLQPQRPRLPLRHAHRARHLARARRPSPRVGT